MVKIIVLERNVMLRTGIVQLLSHVLSDSTIEAHGYATLDQPCDESRQGGLVLLSIPSPERRDSLIQASERAFAPKGIILMLDGEPSPALLHGLPPIVAGFVDKAVAPEIFMACIRLILAGGESSQWSLGPASAPVSVPAPVPAVVRNSALATVPGSVPGSVPAPASAGAMASPRAASPLRRSSDSHLKEPAFLPVSTHAAPLAPDLTPNAARNESSLLGLTPRQYEVLVLLARGDALKTIARRLNISVATTKAHTEGLYQRLDVHNRNAAVYVARARGAGLGWTPPQRSLELGQSGN